MMSFKKKGEEIVVLRKNLQKSQDKKKEREINYGINLMTSFMYKLLNELGNVRK
jgi:hypothetical protein